MVHGAPMNSCVHARDMEMQHELPPPTAKQAPPQLEAANKQRVVSPKTTRDPKHYVASREVELMGFATVQPSPLIPPAHGKTPPRGLTHARRGRGRAQTENGRPRGGGGLHSHSHSRGPSIARALESLLDSSSSVVSDLREGASAWRLERASRAACEH